MLLDDITQSADDIGFVLMVLDLKNDVLVSIIFIIVIITNLFDNIHRMNLSCNANLRTLRLYSGKTRSKRAPIANSTETPKSDVVHDLNHDHQLDHDLSANKVDEKKSNDEKAKYVLPKNVDLESKENELKNQEDKLNNEIVENQNKEEPENSCSLKSVKLTKTESASGKLEYSFQVIINLNFEL